MPATTPARIVSGTSPTVHSLRLDQPCGDSPPRTPTSPARLVGPAGAGSDPGRGRPVRRRAVVALALSLLTLLGAAVAINAAAAPAAPLAAQPAPPPLPLPLPTIEQCPPGSSPVLPGCLRLPVTTPPPPPCTGEGCIPQPPTSPPPTTGPGPGPPTTDEGEADCGITDIGGCITNAINAFFRGIVTAALNPLLDLLSHTLLTTPSPQSIPRIGELWTNSWQILLACYGLLILIAGVLLMAYETVQTRHSVKQIAPRLVVGFLAGALSLWVATKAIALANGLAEAILGGGVDPNTAGTALREMVLSSLTGGIWIIFIGLALAAMLVVLLVTYIIRVAVTILLVAGAPLALMCHALPHTEGIAFWWWKAFGGSLAIQGGQSLVLVVWLKVILAPGGFTIFGPTGSGLVNLLVAGAMVYIEIKIPFWFLGNLRGGRRSAVVSIVRGVLLYKFLGLFRGAGARAAASGGGARPQPATGGGPHGTGRSGAAPDPYRHTRHTADGQYLLPLAGLRRSRPATPPRPAPPPRSRPVRGRQLPLPLGQDWPENRPMLGRDGQYALPLPVTRVPPPPAAPVPPGPPTGGRRGGQQLELPFDPYRGIRPTRSGQYPLPLEGLRRVSTTTTSPTPPAAPPATSVRPARVAGQLRLPLDLPKPPRRPPGGARPKPGGKT
jgi:hypothetical protein